MQKSLNSDILFLIFPFLQLNDLALCQLVCKTWNSIILTPILWKSISDKCDKAINNHSLFEFWLIDKIKHYKPVKLIIFDPQILWSPASILSIFSKANENLKKLNIFFEFDENYKNELTSLICKNCPNLKSFKTHGRFLTDHNMIELKNLNHLSEFAIYNDDAFFTGINLKHLPALSKLYLRPHNIDFDCLKPIIVKSKSELKKLCFDCEIFEPKEILDIINMLSPTQIETLLLYFCEELENEVLFSITRFKKLRNFCFSKGILIRNEGFFKFFNNLDCSNLISLNLTECAEIKDDSISIIANKAKKLQKINLSWCVDINSVSIYQLFINCLYLKKINLTGMKKLNAMAFPYLIQLLEIFDKETFLKDKKEGKVNVINKEFYFKGGKFSNDNNCYLFLKSISLRSCDYIPDEILFILKILFPYIKVINYYGEKVMFD